MPSDKKIKSFMENSKYKNFSVIYEWVIEKSGMLSLKKLRYGKLIQLLNKIYFKKIKEINIIKNVYPSLDKLSHLARIPYIFIKLLHLQDKFVNTVTAAEWFPILSKNNKDDLFRYNITSATR